MDDLKPDTGPAADSYYRSKECLPVMPVAGEKLPLYLNPTRVLVFLAAWIFLAELTSMFILDQMHLSPHGEALLDGLLLLVLISPAYLILYRPFKTHWDERQRCEQEIRYLGRKLISTTDEERRRLARDLHDECGELLSVLQMGIEELKHYLPAEPVRPREQADRMIALVARLGQNFRSLFNRLHPVMLKHFGLVRTVERLVEEYAGQWPDLTFDLSAEGFPEHAHPVVENALFRICQEALSNATRHARAKQIDIRIEVDGKWAVLSVKDDGRGFDVQEAATLGDGNGGIGLLNMRERSVLLGGTFEVSSTPDAGTLVRVGVPLDFQL